MKLVKPFWLSLVIELVCIVGACHAQAVPVVTLTWQDPNSAELGQVLQKSTGAGTNFVFLANLPANATSFADSNVVAATFYQYRINAWNSWGTSTWSNVASTTTPGIPTAPIMLPITVTANNTGTRIQFYAASKGSYRIEERPPGGNWITSTTIAAKRPKQVAWLDVGRWGYEYRVWKII